jgi:hypothetical protein
VAQGPEGLTTKGDNNSWLDPDHPQPADILGELWVHIPGGGRVLTVFANPYTVAAIVLALLIAGSLAAGRRSRRNRTGSAAHGTTTRGTTMGPRLLPTELLAREWAIATALIAIGLAFFAFGRPTTTSVSDKINVPHTAELSYTALVKKPGIYADNRLRTGDPVFLSVAPVLDTHLVYQLGSGPADLTGTISSHAELTASNGWHWSIPLGTDQAINGNHVERTVQLDLPALLRIGHTAEKAAGTNFGGYTVQVVHDIHLKGKVNGQPIVTTDSPKLTLAFDSVQAMLQGDKPPKSGEAIKTTDQSNLAVAASAPATVALLRWHVPISLLRILAIILGIAAAALAAIAIARRRDPGSQHSVFGHRLVSASNAELGGRPIVDVYDAKTLAKLAKLHEAVVVNVARPDGELFLLTIDNTTYRYVEVRSLDPDDPDAFIGPLPATTDEEIAGEGAQR